MTRESWRYRARADFQVARQITCSRCPGIGVQTAQRHGSDNWAVGPGVGDE